MRLFVGLDDTDTLDTPGTNQLARRIAARLPSGYVLRAVLRHQLLIDARIPYTSQNGSASIILDASTGAGGEGWRRDLLPMLRSEVRGWCPEGSDPGLCVAATVASEVLEFGRRCQREPTSATAARSVAEECGVHLEGLGGTEDGVVGALAAVGLAAGGEGRVVHLRGWPWPDPFSGVQTLKAVKARGIEEIRDRRSGAPVEEGRIDVGKRLRPAFRDGHVVLFVEPLQDGESGDPGDPVWRALKLP